MKYRSSHPRLAKLALIITLLAVATASFGVHRSGRLWPWMPGLLAFVTLIWIGLGSRLPLVVWVGTVAVFGTFVRGFIFLWTPSMIGLDPDKFAVAVNRIMAQGSTDAISGLSFYTRVPSSHTLPAEVGLITGIRGQHAVGIYALLLGFVVTLVAAAFVSRVDLHRRSQHFSVGVSATLVAVAPATIYFGVGPIPQSLAAVLLGVIILLASCYQTSYRTRYIVLAGCCALALMLSHKFGIVLLVILSGFSVGIAGVNYYRQPSESISRVARFYFRGFCALSAVAFIQLAFLTDWIVTVVRTAIIPLLSPSLIAAQSDPSFAAAASPSLLSTVIGDLDWLLILPVAGLVCMGLWVRDSSHSLVPLLGGAVTSALFLLLSLVAPGGASTIRVLLFGEPLLLVACGVGIARLRQWRPPRARVVGRLTVGALVTVLVISTAGAALATPDMPGQPRWYLTESEMHAKEFANGHLSDPAATDYYYAREQVSFSTEATYRLASNVEYRGFVPIDAPLLNGSQALRNASWDTFAYREASAYRTGVGIWSLRWDPNSLGRQTNVVYRNGNVTFYSRD